MTNGLTSFSTDVVVKEGHQKLQVHVSLTPNPPQPPNCTRLIHNLTFPVSCSLVALDRASISHFALTRYSSLSFRKQIDFINITRGSTFWPAVNITWSNNNGLSLWFSYPFSPSQFISVFRFSLHYPHKISCLVMRVKEIIINSRV